jgi:hypothetical protein
VAHWPEHKRVCESALSKEDWVPRYTKEGRKAVENSSEGVGNPLKFLWGNTPEFDLLNLKDNEGLDYKGDIELLFAGELPSGEKTSRYI